jgi:hypothetical protein
MYTWMVTQAPLPHTWHLQGRVSREDQRRVDAEAPTHIVLPTGTRARIDYSRDPPAVACKIQVHYQFSLPLPT